MQEPAEPAEPEPADAETDEGREWDPKGKLVEALFGSMVLCNAQQIDIDCVIDGVGEA